MYNICHILIDASVHLSILYTHFFVSFSFNLPLLISRKACLWQHLLYHLYIWIISQFFSKSWEHMQLVRQAHEGMSGIVKSLVKMVSEYLRHTVKKGLVCELCLASLNTLNSSLLQILTVTISVFQMVTVIIQTGKWKKMPLTKLAVWSIISMIF